jgi:hypothetical protein
VSRLRDYLNIKGINPDNNGVSHSLMFRRAVILRGLLEKKASMIIRGPMREVNIHGRVIEAFLRVPEYRHGVRSMEAIIQMALFDKEGSVEKFIASSLPRREQLSMYVDANRFFELVEEPKP